MVRTKMFLDGFNDLERLIETREAVFKAKCKIERVITTDGLGCLDDKSIFTKEEKERFSNLVKALNKASELIADKMIDHERKCVEMNVIGFEPEKKGKPEDTEEDVYF